MTMTCQKISNDLQKMKIDKTPAEIPENKDRQFYFGTKVLLNRVEMKVMGWQMIANVQLVSEAISITIDTLETAEYPKNQ